jgi:hypothetical protein
MHYIILTLYFCELNSEKNNNIETREIYYKKMLNKQMNNKTP